MRQFLNVLLIGVALMMVACGGGEAESSATTSSAENQTSETPAAEESAPATSEDLTENAAIMATLNAADAFDGTVDKVVTKCASCALMMDGKPENKADVAGFEMHFCSTACQESYQTNAKGRLETLKVPSE